MSNTCIDCGCEIVGEKRCFDCYNEWKTGKTHEEIFGDAAEDVGFQEGEDNIAKDEAVRKKISEGIKDSYDEGLRDVRRKAMKKRWQEGVISGKHDCVNENDEKLRSEFEVKFSNFLTQNNIEYIYEKPVDIEHKTKIVDFYLPNYNTFVEVSGYGWDEWKEKFNKDMKALRDAIDNPIILVTYEDKYDEIRNATFEQDMYRISEENLERLIKDLRFISRIQAANEVIQNEGYA